MYPLKVETTILPKVQVFIPSSYVMQNLVIYCLGLKLHKFVETLYFFVFNPCGFVHIVDLMELLF